MRLMIDGGVPESVTFVPPFVPREPPRAGADAVDWVVLIHVPGPHA
jgi:hypothetical protein